MGDAVAQWDGDCDVFNCRFELNARSDRREHGRQVDVDALVRGGRAAGARGLLAAGRRRRAAAPGRAQRARRRRGRRAEGAEHLHAGDARVRRHPAGMSHDCMLLRQTF